MSMNAIDKNARIAALKAKMPVDSQADFKRKRTGKTSGKSQPGKRRPAAPAS